jgi:hypothetical protein
MEWSGIWSIVRSSVWSIVWSIVWSSTWSFALCSMCLNGVADAVAYSAPNAFVANQPLFTYDDGGYDIHSFPHKTFDAAEDSKQLLEATLLNNKNEHRTYHGDRYQYCLMDLGFMPPVLASMSCMLYTWGRASVELLAVLFMLVQGFAASVFRSSPLFLRECFGKTSSVFRFCFCCKARFAPSGKEKAWGRFWKC